MSPQPSTSGGLFNRYNPPPGLDRVSWNDPKNGRGRPPPSGLCHRGSSTRRSVGNPPSSHHGFQDPSGRGSGSNMQDPEVGEANQTWNAVAKAFNSLETYAIDQPPEWWEVTECPDRLDTLARELTVVFGEFLLSIGIQPELELGPERDGTSIAESQRAKIESAWITLQDAYEAMERFMTSHMWVAREMYSRNSYRRLDRAGVPVAFWRRWWEMPGEKDRFTAAQKCRFEDALAEFMHELN